MTAAPAAASEWFLAMVTEFCTPNGAGVQARAAQLQAVIR
ncbi:hypothetical protein FHX82_007045 [Amycolatopsis bartoniae]|nr:hypothetical protein [Amycolatopsis bartoniae]